MNLLAKEFEKHNCLMLKELRSLIDISKIKEKCLRP